ncbi:MAG: asparagine synthase (glutamine-hydrolyzing) [Bacteroidetes bacterium]|nr:asparagine synthase (glutamine-hydrolyzing) [Bacteroidota bacterium]
MCGINGVVGRLDGFRSNDVMVHMNHAITHRGPDAQGIFTEPGVVLGHRRLSIIDLSDQGRQPMYSADGRYVIVFNGEIYNYQSLKARVKDYPFETDTDTEVILALYSIYGSGAIEQLDGMFAIAIWDREEKELVLARDRMGKKPLYYYQEAGLLVFSSEIRGLLASGLVKPKLNRSAISSYLQFQTVYSPDTILEGVKMFKAGYLARIKQGIWDEKRYWNTADGLNKYSLTGPYDKVVKQTRELFLQAVQKRLVSDVPLGAFLSGGVDSSCVVAAMAHIHGKGIKTFHIGFQEGEFSESRYAALVADKFGTEHHEIILQPTDFLAELPDSLNAMDHPSADGPNTYIVSKHTKAAGITVALSGLGGDELFGGYPVFSYLRKLQRLRMAGQIPQYMRSRLVGMLGKRLEGPRGEKLKALAQLKNWDWEHLYPVFRQAMGEKELATAGYKPANVFNPGIHSVWGPKLMSEISIAEMNTYMENVLLRDTDQMSMAHALEVRVPFLDKDLIEFVLSLPDDFKPLNPPKKLIIDAMGDWLPAEVWNRPKMGFTLPWKLWMNRELKGFVKEKLDYLEQTELFSPAYIQGLRNTLETESNPKWYPVWNLVVLSHWLEKNKVYA